MKKFRSTEPSSDEQQIKTVSCPRNHLYRTAHPLGPRRFCIEILPFQRNLHHLREFAHDLDLDRAAFGRRHRHPLDQSADYLQRLIPAVLVIERLGEGGDAMPVDFGLDGDAGGSARRREIDHGPETRLLRLQCAQALLQAVAAQPSVIAVIRPSSWR